MAETQIYHSNAGSRTSSSSSNERTPELRARKARVAARNQMWVSIPTTIHRPPVKAEDMVSDAGWDLLRLAGRVLLEPHIIYIKHGSSSRCSLTPSMPHHTLPSSCPSLAVREPPHRDVALVVADSS